MDPLRDLDRMEQLQRSLTAQSEAVRRSMIPVPDWAEAAVEQERRLRESMGVLYYRDHLTSIVDAYQKALPSLKIAGFELGRWQEIIEQHEHMRKQWEGISSFALPSMLWESSMSRILESMDAVGLLDRHPALSDRLLQPYNYFSKFSRETYSRLEAGVEDAEGVALGASLVLAEEEVADAAEFLIETLEEPSEEQPLVEAPKLNLLEVQRADLILVGNIPGQLGYDDLLLLTPSAQVARLARRINQAIIDCNQISQVAGREEIFKPTTASMEAQNNLPWIIADDKSSFGNVVDFLYIMLYEAAGKDKLRFAPFVTDEDCAVIWTIKHLRNKWLRHDPDHGSDASIRKSRQQLKEALARLGAASVPMTENEFRLVQQKLLSQALAFLEHLKGKLTESVAADTSNQRTE